MLQSIARILKANPYRDAQGQFTDKAHNVFPGIRQVVEAKRGLRDQLTSERGFRRNTGQVLGGARQPVASVINSGQTRHMAFSHTHQFFSTAEATRALSKLQNTYQRAVGQGGGVAVTQQNSMIHVRGSVPEVPQRVTGPIRQYGRLTAETQRIYPQASGVNRALIRIDGLRNRSSIVEQSDQQLNGILQIRHAHSFHSTLIARQNTAAIQRLYRDNLPGLSADQLAVYQHGSRVYVSATIPRGPAVAQAAQPAQAVPTQAAPVQTPTPRPAPTHPLTALQREHADRHFSSDWEPSPHDPNDMVNRRTGEVLPRAMGLYVPRGWRISNGDNPRIGNDETGEQAPLPQMNLPAGWHPSTTREGQMYNAATNQYQPMPGHTATRPTPRTPAAPTPVSSQVPVPVQPVNLPAVPMVSRKQTGHLLRELSDFESKHQMRISADEMDTRLLVEHTGLTPRQYAGALLKHFEPGEIKNLSVTFNADSFTPGKFSYTLEGKVKNGGSWAELSMTRYVNLREKKVDHAYWTMSETGGNVAADKTSAGKKFFKASLDLYDHMGINKVEVHANIDVGGYAWARYGFVPTQESWDAMRLNGGLVRNGTSRIASVRPKVEQIENVAVRNRVLGLLENPDPRAMLVIAAMRDKTRPSGIDTVGKTLFLGGHWFGTLHLDSAEVYSVTRHYTGSRG